MMTGIVKLAAALLAAMITAAVPALPDAELIAEMAEAADREEAEDEEAEEEPEPPAPLESIPVVPAKRLAHQKNSAERVADAYRFDGIEVDVRETGENGDIALYHDEYHGLTLQMFLESCKENGQLAILDMKSGSNYEDVVNCVTAMEMIPQTIFQVGKGVQAEEIRGYNGEARCWLLNGVGSEYYLRLQVLEDYAEYFEGLNVCGSVLWPELAEDCIAAVHEIEGTAGPMTVCVFAYGAHDNVYNGDEIYEKYGADYLMTDLYPGDGETDPQSEEEEQDGVP